MARVARDLWCKCVNINNMENTCQGGLHYEEGTFVTQLRLSCHEAYIYQLSHVALEHSAEKRVNFTACISSYNANQLVLMDESAIDHCTTYCGRTWAMHGCNASRKCFFS